MTNSLYKFEDIVINYCERVQPQPGDEKYYVGLEHLTSGTFSVDTSGSSTELDGQKIKMKKGDVLFARRRAYQKKVGIAPFDGIFSAHGMIIRPKDDVIIQDFLPFFISSDYFLNRAIKLSVGSLSPTLNWGTIKTEMFSIPDKKSQEQYSALLWKLEEYKVLCQNNINILEQLIKSRFIELFGHIKTNEKNWSIVTLESIAKINDGEHSSPPKTESGHKYLMARNIQPGHVLDLSVLAYVDETVHKKVYSRCNPETDDLLLTNTGTIGNTLLMPEMEEISLDRGITLIKYDRSKVNGIFLQTCLDTTEIQSEIQNGIHKSAIAHFFLTETKKLCVPLPPIELQKEFAEFVKQVDKSRLSLQQHLEDTKQLQRSIINSIFGDAE